MKFTQKRAVISAIAAVMLCGGAYIAHTQDIIPLIDATTNEAVQTDGTPKTIFIDESETEGTYTLKVQLQGSSKTYTFTESREIDVSSLTVLVGGLIGPTQNGTVVISKNGTDNAWAQFFGGRTTDHYIFPTPLKLRQGDKINVYTADGQDIAGGISLYFIGKRPSSDIVLIK